MYIHNLETSYIVITASIYHVNLLRGWYMWISDIQLQYTRWTSACDIPTKPNPENKRRHCFFHMAKERAAKAMARLLDHSTTTKEQWLHLIYEVVHLPETTTVPGRLPNIKLWIEHHQAKQLMKHRPPVIAILMSLVFAVWWLESLCEEFSFKAAYGTRWTLPAIEDSQVRKLSAEKVNVKVQTSSWT